MAVVDPRVRSLIMPTRVVWQSAPPPEGAEHLLSFHTGQASLRGTPSCVLRNGAGLVLDFGRAWHGGVQMIVGDTAERKAVGLRVRFGESVAEAMGSPVNDHAIHDEVVAAPWLGLRETGTTVFRFVRIDLHRLNNLIRQ